MPRICTHPQNTPDYPPTPTTESNDLRPRGPPVTAILPFLYLGNEEGAADEKLIDRLSIKYILNMTPVCPNYFIQKADMHYKQIKICDSNQADIGQYFEEAVKFIGKFFVHQIIRKFIPVFSRSFKSYLFCIKVENVLDLQKLILETLKGLKFCKNMYPFS